MTARPPSNCRLVPARPGDAAAIAALHIESWRSAYRGLLPDEFLDGPIVPDRTRLWNERMVLPSAERRLVLKAMSGDALCGFVCVLLDEEPQWGALLDNLHVRPALKGQGIGRQLFQAARDWVTRVAPGERMHLWVIEGNASARRFYDRQGGVVAERRIVETVPGVEVAALRYVWGSD